MTSIPPPGTDGPTEAQAMSSALSSFLRGIERRAVVLAGLQMGDAIQGEQAFAVVLRQFRSQALSQSYGHWQRLFWRTLLASPQLRSPPPTAGRWPPEQAALGQVGPGPRAALLLRLAAGLTEVDAAAVLGVPLNSYRLALLKALPRIATGAADAEAWRQLDAEIKRSVSALSAERLAHLARLREAAVQGRRPELIGPLPPPAPAPVARPHARLRRVLWSGVVACVLGLAASFVVPMLRPADDGDPDIHVAALGPAVAPASRYDTDLALLTERDFELLLDGPPQPPLDDPGFHAWLASGRAGQPDAGSTAKTTATFTPDAAPPAQPPRTPLPDDDATPETSDAPL